MSGDFKNGVEDVRCIRPASGVKMRGTSETRRTLWKKLEEDKNRDETGDELDSRLQIPVRLGSCLSFLLDELGIVLLHEEEGFLRMQT